MSITILVIEDDLIIANGLKENLEDLGYSEIHLASCAEEALTKVRAYRPDLFIVDITLKGSKLDGVELVHVLKKDHNVPYIFLTSMDDAESKERAKKTNPSAYLIKPASKSQISITIDIAMNTHFRMQQAVEAAQQSFLSRSNDRVFVKSGDRYQRINLPEVVYLEAEGSYCHIHTVVKTFILSLSLGKVIEQLQSADILRTHKTYAVNENHVSSFDQFNVYVERHKESVAIPVSRNQKEEVQKRLRKL